MKAFDNLGKSVKNFTDKNSSVVLIEESNYFSLPFFIIGAVLGAILGLVFTPDTGENNRRKIEEKFNELTQNKDDEFEGQNSYQVREVSDQKIKSIEVERENINLL